MFKYTKILSRYILLIIGVLLLIGIFGCNKENRCNRIKARHPECFETLLIPIETIRVDTAYKTYPVTDTIFKITENNTVDTFLMITAKVKTRIIRQHDTIKVYQEVTPDTIIKTEIKTVQRISSPKPYPFIPLWMWAVLGTLCVVIFLLIRFKR